MIHLQLAYLFSVLILAGFGFSFFCFDYYAPYIKKWKANKLHFQTQVYLDEKIGSSPELVREGIKKAKVAYLLDPQNRGSYENYLELLYLDSPEQALSKWSRLVDNSENGISLGNNILRKALKHLNKKDAEIESKVIVGEIALSQFQYLMEIEGWDNQSQNLLLGAEILAETGNHEQALELVNEVLESNPEDSTAVFILTRLTVHLKDRSQLLRLGKALAPLSSQRNEVGVEAIRHMTLLNFLQPLAPQSLERCIGLLSVNPNAKAIDFLRIYAMLYAIEESDFARQKIISKCGELFDLDDSNQLLVFANWLSRIRAHQAIVKYVPALKAKAEQNFFQIRMAALAHIGDLEKMRAELNRASIIPSRWRLVVEARIFAMEQNFIESQKSLERIIPLLSNDPREARAICVYLEQVDDIQSLCHILEKLSQESIHQKYAVTKLLQYQGATVGLEKLIEWSEILLSINPDATKIRRSNLYFRLLDPALAFPSQEQIQLTEEAKKYDLQFSTMESRITLALAYLKNNSAADALVALGKVNNWREWEKVRPAWRIIAAQVFKQNGDTEKFLILSRGIKVDELNRAERESLQAIFNFKIG